MAMKKIVIILYSVFLSVLFVSQAPSTITTLQLLTNTEHVFDSSNHNGDNCQEDHFIKTNTVSILIPFKNHLTSAISLNTIPGNTPYLWQPPE
jgi:hypothetical protein